MVKCITNLCTGRQTAGFYLSGASVAPVIRALGAQKIMTHRTFFKCYLFVMAILLPLFFYMEMDGSGQSDAFDYFDYFMWLIGLVGIYGYTFKKTIFGSEFWRYFLPVLVVWDAFITFREFISEFKLEGEPYLYALIILYIIILIPEYIGLYLYGFKFRPGT